MQLAPPMSHLKGSVLVLGVGVVVSFGALAFRFASDQGSADAWEYLFFRGLGMMIATCLVLGFRHRSKVWSELAHVRLPHLGIGAVLAFISCAYIIALEVASVAFVLLLQTMAPIIAAYLSWIFMSERVSRQAVIATAVSIVGIVVMFSGALTEDIEPEALFAIAIPIGFALYATLVRSTEGMNSAVPLLTAGIALVLVGAIAVKLGSGFNIEPQDALIGIFAGSFLFGFPLAVFNVAQKMVPSPETTLLMMSEVVLAPLWAWMFVSEVPEVTTLVGGAIVLASVVWLTLSRRHPAS